MRGLICMHGFGYDPEVPAGYQDADIETLELREAAREADELHQEGVRMEKETITLDDQDLKTLLELVTFAFAGELSAEVIMGRSKERPTTRMVSLKSIEMKLIRMQQALR